MNLVNAKIELNKIEEINAIDKNYQGCIAIININLSLDCVLIFYCY